MGPVSRIASIVKKPLLEKAMENLLTKPVKLYKESFGLYKANLDNGIVGDIYPGGSFGSTSIYVTDGKKAIEKELPPGTWLENWQVIKNIKVNH